MRFTPLMVALILITGWLSALPAAADTSHYVFPTNLSLGLSPIGSWSPNTGGVLQARVQSLLGTLKQLEIFFECSPDLTVHPTRSTVPELAEGGTETVPVVVGKGPGQPDEMGSWVRLRVRYHPDFDRITTVVSDLAAYPNSYERQRLLEIVARNRRDDAPYTTALRFFAR